MKVIFTIFTIVSICLACSDIEPVNDKIDVEDHQIEEFNNQNDLNDTVLVKLKGDIIFSWDNHRGEFIRDSMYKSLMNNFSYIKEQLINSIDDSSDTDAKSCGDGKQLSVGSLSFILLDDSLRFPYSMLFEQQLDVIDKGCTIPIGIFKYIDENGEVAKNKIRKFIEKHASN